MPPIDVQQKAVVVVNAGSARQTIIAQKQSVGVVVTSPTHIGVDAHAKRVVVVRVG